MVNCNPETVSTDYDTSDRLYFEPLDAEEVLEVCDRERPTASSSSSAARRRSSSRARSRRRATGSWGRRTTRSTWPRIASASARSATSSASAPGWGIAERPREAVDVAEAIGYPVLVRPVVRARRPRDARLLRRTQDVARGGTRRAACSSTGSSRTRSRSTSTRSATATRRYVAAVMQHVEEAGVHSGDSSCVLPAPSLTTATARRSRTSCAGSRPRSASSAWSTSSSRRRRRGLRARGEPAGLADRAVREQGDRRQPRRRGLPARRRRAARATSACRAAAAEQVSVKAAVLPFARFPGADPVLGPGDALDRRGDGERGRLPDRLREGRARSRAAAAERARVPLRARRATRRRRSRSPRALAELGFGLVATAGTARRARGAGIAVERVAKVTEAGRADRRRPHPPRALRPRREHARRRLGRALRRLPRSARRRSPRACRASRRWPAPRGRRTRSRTPARAGAVAAGAVDARDAKRS